MKFHSTNVGNFLEYKRERFQINSHASFIGQLLPKDHVDLSVLLCVPTALARTDLVPAALAWTHLVPAALARELVSRRDDPLSNLNICTSRLPSAVSYILSSPLNHPRYTLTKLGRPESESIKCSVSKRSSVSVSNVH